MQVINMMLARMLVTEFIIPCAADCPGSSLEVMRLERRCSRQQKPVQRIVGLIDRGFHSFDPVFVSPAYVLLHLEGFFLTEDDQLGLHAERGIQHQRQALVLLFFP